MPHMKKPTIEDYITPPEAATLLGVAAPTIYDAIKAGKLTTHEILGKTVLLREEVVAYPLRPNRRRKSVQEK